MLVDLTQEQQDALAAATLLYEAVKELLEDLPDVDKKLGYEAFWPHTRKNLSVAVDRYEGHWRD